MKFAYTASPVGTLKITEDASGICGIEFTELENLPEYDCAGAKYLPTALRELAEYFEGKRNQFTVPVSLHGTPFQKRVWQALSEIPYGQTRTYGEIAATVGNPKACRAVGMANHRNPVSIIIPCHRVIGKNGTLTGYGGGLSRKEYLLKLENIEF